MTHPGQMNPLERCDVELIVSALNHYKHHVRNSEDYPSYEFRQEQLDRINETLGRFLTIAPRTVSGSDR